MVEKKKRTPFQIERARKKREKIKLKRAARIAREQLLKANRRAKAAAKREARERRRQARVARRKARAAIKAAPRKSLKAWAEAVAKNAGYRCEICGVGVTPVLLADGSQKLDKKGRPVLSYLDAHHLLDKVLYKEYRYDLRNSLLLCKRHHKWHRLSPHKGGIWFAIWLFRHRRAKFDFVKQVLGDFDNVN